MSVAAGCLTIGPELPVVPWLTSSWRHFSGDQRQAAAGGRPAERDRHGPLPRAELPHVHPGPGTGKVSLVAHDENALILRPTAQVI
jgi:hypothetical protein